jgi:hypothetical protein
MMTLLVGAVAVGMVGEPPALLDDFDDLTAWATIASDGVSAKAQRDGAGESGACLRLDVDFTKGAGYCIVRRAVELELPAATDGSTGNYEFTFDVRGELPANNLEFKLVDDGGRAGGAGESVWWVNRRAFEFPARWTTLVNKRRHVQFAWGPSGGKPLKRIAAIEFAVASAKGGRGSVWIDNLRFRLLPEPRAIGTPSVSSSSSAGAGAEAALAVDEGEGWRPAADDRAPRLALDLGGTCEIGGVTLELTGQNGVDSRAHVRVATAEEGGEFGEEVPGYVSAGGHVFVPLPERDAQRARVRFEGGSGGDWGVRAARVRGPEFAATPSDFVRSIAGAVKPGRWPRQFLGRQSYWTVVGLAGGEDEALINEEGQVELWDRGPSLEAFVFARGRLLTWADDEHASSLEKRYIPIPTVTREMEGLTLRITACADGEIGDSHRALLVRYELSNTGSEAAEGSLLLALRPLQVNPPWQNLNTEGGVANVRGIEIDKSGGLSVGDRAVLLAPKPESLGATSLLQAGDVVDFFERGTAPELQRIDDEAYPSAGARYVFRLKQGESVRCYAEMVRGDMVRPGPAPEEIEARIGARAHDWEERLNRVGLTVPPAGQRLADAMRSNLAYILINADGPAIQPGSRCYARSWIRDGCLTSSALLAMGHADEAVRFIDWYGEHLFDSGKVPCVVDRRGPDPVPENDSHGEYIFAVMNAYRFTGDKSILERHWERVKRVAGYIDSLRQQRRTEEFAGTGAARQEPGKPVVPVRAFYGLMPESISHEGYSAKPMHSYWDDLFTLRGLKDAAEMAGVRGDSQALARFGAMRDEFSADLAASLKLTMSAHGIDYVPGCVELGDFDSTSTTIALWPVGVAGVVPEEALRATFDRYWRFFQERAAAGATWDGFTPYELRHIGAFIRLGQPDRARAVLEWMLRQQRPAGWNHWAEVVFRDRDSARFIGDMPHTWCGSDFINSARSMFVYEREDDGSLVVFAGVPEAWMESEGGVAIEGWPTWYGSLTASVRSDGSRRVMRLSGAAKPPGGVVIGAGRGDGAKVSVNGQPAAVNGRGEIVVHTLPAEVVIER